MLLLIDPELAVISTVLEPASWVGLLDEELDPLHPASDPIARAIVPRQSNCVMRRRLPKTSNSGSKERGRKAAKLIPVSAPLLADAVDDLMVSVVVAVLPLPSDIWPGLKPHVIPIGSPEQLKDTVPIAPYFDAI